MPDNRTLQTYTNQHLWHLDHCVVTVSASCELESIAGIIDGTSTLLGCNLSTPSWLPSVWLPRGLPGERWRRLKQL